MVAQELHQEAKAQGVNFGATNVYTSEKCRVRWSYLHLQRKLGKSISYKSVSPNATASEADTDKENRNEQNQASGSSSRIGQLLHAKKAPKAASGKKKWTRETEGTADLQKNIQNAKDLLEAKDFSTITERTEPKTMADIEASLWK